MLRRAAALVNGKGVFFCGLRKREIVGRQDGRREMLRRGSVDLRD